MTSVLDRGPPALKVLRDADHLTMVGTRRSYLFVPQMLRGMRVTGLDWKFKYEDELEKIIWLIDGEQVVWDGRTYEVEFDPFSRDPAQPIRFKPVG